MNAKQIDVVISFSQSKKYPTDWKVRYVFKDGYAVVLIHDEISKSTQFGNNPDNVKMRDYATEQVEKISKALGFDNVVIFS